MRDELAKRIQEELKTVGVGLVGLHTPESKEIARIINKNEHIEAAVYGKYTGGLAWLIATDQRILFIDKKPMFNSTDELSYEIVSGVRSIRAGLFTSLILHTKAGDYSLRFVGAKAAEVFKKYIDNRIASAGRRGNDVPSEAQSLETAISGFPTEGLKFIKEHDLAVLSTIDRTGNVHGAVVYYVIDRSDYIYILTRAGTGKGRNVYAHSQVALTIHEPGTLQTVQLSGLAEVVTDQQTKDMVFENIAKPRNYRGKKELPPVTKMTSGSYMAIRIAPTIINYHDYSK